MTTKLVCRLMTADGQMLGWCSHYAAARGDGYLRSTLPVVLDIDEPGETYELSIHWADMNVEIRVAMPKAQVTRGQSWTIFQPHAQMIQVGQPPVGRLPPVTVTSREAIEVPVGQLGAMSVA
jgi:hypothetical protein